MLAYFPTAYPDELLFSVVSRLAEMMGYPRSNDLSRAVYGQDRPMVEMGLPSHMAGVVAALPLGHPLTTDKLIHEQTLYPFYQPFLLAKSAQTLKALLCSRDGSKVPAYTGLSLKSIRPSPWLRFCYDCVQTDRAQYGACYWHRLHQLPGVKICPQHGAIIQDSQVPTYHRTVKHRYISAEQALTQAAPCPNPLTQTAFQECLWIAQDAAWLLNNLQPHLTPEALQTKLYQVLADQSLASYNRGMIRAAMFLRAFAHHYAADLLNLLECPLDYGNAQAWPIQVITRAGRKHPLQYLLVIHFLGYRAETFLTLPEPASYFGQGPWPCLNPACLSYQQPVIETCQIDFQGADTRPRGTFACSCGFVYRRVGPDQEAADRFRIGRVVTYGPVWDNRFQQLGADPRLSTEDMARQLNIEPTTLMAYAARQNQVAPEQPLPLETRTYHRNRWLAALEQSPAGCLHELRQDPALNETYRWLLQHDRAWYEAHRPALANRTGVRKTKSIYPDHYWRNRDVQLAEAIRLAARQLLKQPGQPLKISLTALCNHLNQGSFTSRRAKLPLTARTLAAVMEPYEVFVIRRLEWVLQQYRAKGITPPKRVLTQESGLACFGEPKWQDFANQILARLTSRADLEPSLVHDFLPCGQQDWPTLDAELSELVRQAARQLKAKSGYPTWVTICTIGAELDQLEVLLCHLDLLPRTGQTLTEVVEPVEVFVTRVMEWMANTGPDTWSHRARLIRLAGLKPYLHLPAVSRIIDDTCARLQAPSPLSSRRVDWIARDQTLASAITEAADLIRNRLNPPQRVTRGSLAQVVDSLGLIKTKTWHVLVRCLDRLPETRQAFEQVQETHEQFAQRRLYIVANRFRPQGLRPTRTQLLRQANVEYLATCPLIQATIEEILQATAALPSASEVATRRKWAELDQRLSRQIESTAEHLKALTDPPVWVSTTAIAKHIGYQLQPSNLENLPQTAKFLAQAVETREEFAIRQRQYR